MAGTRTAGPLPVFGYARAGTGQQPARAGTGLGCAVPGLAVPGESQPGQPQAPGTSTPVTFGSARAGTGQQPALGGGGLAGGSVPGLAQPGAAQPGAPQDDAGPGVTSGYATAGTWP